MAMDYRIFISHGWADRGVASQIDRRPRDAGAMTFIDVHDIEKGDDIEDRIFENMRACQELLVLFAPWSVDRNWLWVEIGAARSWNMRIVAVLYQTDMGALDRDKGGTTFLRSRNLVDINDLEAYFEEVAKRVERIVQ
jgi:hypothetical protein